MKNRRFLALLVSLFVLLGWQISPAQMADSVQKKVVKKLEEIKPTDTKDFIYKIAAADKIEKLPDDLRLDIIYRIGHYEWDLVALRFEREKANPLVKVTQFRYSSTLDFYREWNNNKPDSYAAQQGQIAVKDFDRLLTLAYTLYKSDIKREETPREPCDDCPLSSLIRIPPMDFSTADGLIILNLKSVENNPQIFIKESGVLHTGDLKIRAASTFERVRAHLFWEVFNDALGKQNIFADLEKSKTEEIAISRLEEPQMINDYNDYFRQLLYILLLGETGTSKALPILETKAKTGGLEKDWDETLTRAARAMIGKIKARKTDN
jgi:hypothetical protein